MAQKIADKRVSENGKLTWAEAVKLLGKPIDILSAPNRERRKVVGDYFSTLGSQKRKVFTPGGINYPECASCGYQRICEACVSRDVNRYVSNASQARKSDTRKSFPVYGQFDSILSPDRIANIAQATIQHTKSNGRGDIVLVYGNGKTEVVASAAHIPGVAAERGGMQPVVAILKPMDVEEVADLAQALSTDDVFDRIEEAKNQAVA